jgi:hypothetical protein
MRKGSKFTPEQLERVCAANRRKAQDANWRATMKAAGKRRSQDPKWRAALEKVVKDPEWLAANEEASNRPEVIESKMTYGPKQPWNRSTITTEKNLKRFDEGMCRYCQRPRQPERKECYDCFVRGLETRRRHAAKKKAKAKAQAQLV